MELATECSNCQSTEKVWGDTGLCQDCEAELVTELDALDDECRRKSLPHYEAIQVLRNERDAKKNNWRKEYGVPDERWRSRMD